MTEKRGSTLVSKSIDEQGQYQYQNQYHEVWDRCRCGLPDDAADYLTWNDNTEVASLMDGLLSGGRYRLCVQ